jgi:hypothetical protein
MQKFLIASYYCLAIRKQISHHRYSYSVYWHNKKIGLNISMIKSGLPNLFIYGSFIDAFSGSYHKISGFCNNIYSIVDIRTIVKIYTYLEARSSSSLRQYAKSRKVAGSITDEIIRFFYYLILPAALLPCGRLNL